MERKYTPISQITQRGYIDFLIKVYRKNVHPKFPDGGLMSQYMENMELGQKMLMYGPKGRLQYLGNGDFLIGKEHVLGVNRIGLIAGGTGITPCYQVLQSILVNNDHPEVSLVFGNRTVDDILLRDELEAFAKNHPDKFNLHFTVDVQPEGDWNGGVGFITEKMLKDHLPAPGFETLILYCGPPPFEKMMKQHLGKLGHQPTAQFKF